MTVTPKKDSAQPASSSYNHTSPRFRRTGAVQMEDIDGLRVKLHHEDSVLLASSLAEPINLEDFHYAQLQGEIDYDAHNLEAESWSVAVDQNYLKALNKEAVKRQDVIYELMQTEMHHVRTLKILLHVYMHELRKSQLMEEAKLERLFPGVETLLGLHQDFLNCLKEHQSQCQEDGGPNYQITNLGDILISQFSGAQGESMKENYSVFCSHQSEAVSFYKEQLQNNKKFQFVIKKISQLPLVRRLGIPECFLLVTQRITKYPVLVERIIQNTEAETGEYQSLVQGLALIKDAIFHVNAHVSEYEKLARLSQRLEPKSQGRMKDGRLFRREDLIQGKRLLLYEGNVTWKTSSKLKDVYAVLLSDMLLLLQEKDQKLVFATMDNKPPVISLQRLIVREVANEHNAMFLICTCTSGLPEMYEIHASSREECFNWMGLIRETVECCRKDDEYHKLIAKLQKFQDDLKEKDDQIKQCLADKQQVFAGLYQTSTGEESPHKELLLQQGETLLEGAIDELENLQSLIFLRIKDPKLQRVETFSAAISEYTMNYPHLQEMFFSEGLEQSADDDSFLVPDLSSNHFPEPEVCDSVAKLAQLLYSLQAFVAQQDSQTELQGSFQSKIQQPSHHYSGVLLEQEKQRNLEKQKEQLGNLQKLQAQQREEQLCWEKEKAQQRIQIENQEAQLKQREEYFKKWEEKLREEKEDLERQKDEHQLNLETLRDSVKLVEKEKERLTQERERLEKVEKNLRTKLLSSTNYDNVSKIIINQSFRGSVVNGGEKLSSSGKPPWTSNISADPLEIPPKVPPRGKSITANQGHMQQIPFKLAGQTKGKRSKSKRSHQRTKSAASIDVNQLVPIQVSGKAGGSLRSTRRTSPQRIYQPDIFMPPNHKPLPTTPNVRTSPSFGSQKRHSSSDESPPVPPPFPKEILKPKKEKELFF